MNPDVIRELYEYHWWANRRLFEVTLALGPEAATREVGSQFSFPTLKGMFAHIYGADWFWLARWKGSSPPRLPGDPDFASLTALREPWNALEQEQRVFLEGLTPDDVRRLIEYRNLAGKALRAPLRVLLQHVPNHATHHRSEIATMLTMIGSSPPDTGLHTFILLDTGQA